MRFKIEKGEGRFEGQFLLIEDGPFPLTLGGFGTLEACVQLAQRMVNDARRLRTEAYNKYEEADDDLNDLEEALEELLKEVQ